jgi:hypothetical protein
LWSCIQVFCQPNLKGYATQTSDLGTINYFSDQNSNLIYPVPSLSYVSKTGFTSAKFLNPGSEAEKIKPDFYQHVASFDYTRFSQSFFRKKLKDSVNTKVQNQQKVMLRNEEKRFWGKVGRAELIIGGIEIIGMGILISMPKEVTKWKPGWIKDAKENLSRAFTTMPVWDKDDWPINYVGHPVIGSYYYNSVRSQNANWWQSLLFATAQSCIWEYMIEGAAEKPSIQDLVVTPLCGALIGEPVHLATMSMRKNGFRFIEKVFVLLLNPMFVINNGFGPRHNPVRVKY